MKRIRWTEGETWFLAFIPSRWDRFKAWLWRLEPRWLVRYRMRGWTQVGHTLDLGSGYLREDQCPHCGSDDICDDTTPTDIPVAPGTIWCGSCGAGLSEAER